jgi:hypothetical protein
MANLDDTSHLERQSEIDTCGPLGGSGGQWFWPRRYPHALSCPGRDRRPPVSVIMPSA